MNALKTVGVRVIAFPMLTAALAAAEDTAPSGEPNKKTPKPGSTAPVYVLPITVGEVTGWARDFTRSGNIDVNNYLTYLDRVRDDPAQTFNVGEIITLVNMRHMRPDRYRELVEYVKQGRIEPAHGFFVGECETSLSGGEALVRQGVEGQRWNREVLGFRPRAWWYWDDAAIHEQMAQIAAGLGLDAYVYTRSDWLGSRMDWAISPDGSRTLRVSSPYQGWGAYTCAGERLRADQIVQLEDESRWHYSIRKFVEGVASFPSSREILYETPPSKAPRLVFNGDESSLCTPYKGYPSEFIRQWREVFPQVELRFSTMSKYLEALMPMAKGGELDIPEFRGGCTYLYQAFWVQSPKAKQYFRRSEHALQAAEMLAAIASLRDGSFTYPSEDLNHAWIALLLNMGRNNLWGCCTQSVLEDDVAWDVTDRYEYVRRAAADASSGAMANLVGCGKRIGLFNPANWPRRDVVKLRLPEGTQLKGVPCQPAENGMTLCQVDLPPVGVRVLDLEPATQATRPINLPAAIENSFYRAVIDPRHGDLVSLKLKGGDRELLDGPANVIVADQNDPSKGQNASQAEGCEYRPKRKPLMSSRATKALIHVTDGPVAITVQTENDFLGGGKLRRTMRFSEQSPRIDFTTELNDLPAITTVMADFPLAGDVVEVRRGIPYGFSHGSWGHHSDKSLVRAPWGITPAIRWSDYTLKDGGGVALLDQGLTGREIIGNRVSVYLHHTSDTYVGDKNWESHTLPQTWLSGKGRTTTSYALLPHAEPWNKASVTRFGWEFNCPPIMAQADEAKSGTSFVTTSDNLLMESMRREGDELELRMVECLGIAAAAEVTVHLPHGKAVLTNLLGEERRDLPGGPNYRFQVRPQQIVTLRLKTAQSVAPLKALTDWTPLVPEAKRARLYELDPNLKGWGGQSQEFQWQTKHKYKKGSSG
jgi:alpha-mannosidase